MQPISNKTVGHLFVSKWVAAFCNFFFFPTFVVRNFVSASLSMSSESLKFLDFDAFVGRQMGACCAKC
jgi:hypothetical protein